MVHVIRNRYRLFGWDDGECDWGVLTSAPLISAQRGCQVRFLLRFSK